MGQPGRPGAWAGASAKGRGQGATGIDPALRAILRCPATGQELEEGGLDGAAVLISQGAALAYPVRDGVPILLEHEARPLG